jgi:hypothetical protein
MKCCDQGGCWKSRVVPVGDGDEKDRPENMCVDVVHQRDTSKNFKRESCEGVPGHADPNAPGRVLEDYLPRCMDLITAEEVIRRVRLYFDGGAISYLDEEQRRACASTIPALEWCAKHDTAAAQAATSDPNKIA